MWTILLFERGTPDTALVKITDFLTQAIMEELNTKVVKECDVSKFAQSLASAKYVTQQ